MCNQENPYPNINTRSYDKYRKTSLAESHAMKVKDKYSPEMKLTSIGC